MTQNNITANVAINTIDDLQAIGRLCADSESAVPINIGSDEMVMLSKKQYEDIGFRLFEADVITGVLKSQQDIIEGRVISGEDALEKLSRKFGL